MASPKQINKPRNHQFQEREIRNLATDFFINEQIITTKASAKELQRHVEKLITVAKVDNVANRRKVSGYLRNVKTKDNVHVVDKLFKKIGKKYQKRDGGYTRILKWDNRKGDGALEVIITLV